MGGAIDKKHPRNCVAISSRQTGPRARSVYMHSGALTRPHTDPTPLKSGGGTAVGWDYEASRVP